MTLEEAKADKRLARMALVTQSRLSVQPVTDAEWAVICKLGGLWAGARLRAKRRADRLVAFSLVRA